MLTTFWVCVAHRWAVPPTNCQARGTGDAGAARHTQREPKHPTLTTTRRELADKYAAPGEETPR